MLKKTSAVGGLAIAATAAGMILTSTPASAQAPMWRHRHHHGIRNVNVNRNHNRIIVRVRIKNRNNNVAIARNDGFRRGFFDHGFFGRSCCRNRFWDDDDDGFDGRRRFRDFDDDGVTAIIRGGDIFAHSD